MRALHAKGIVHRDLKPQNILLSHSHPGDKAYPPPQEIRLKIGEFFTLFIWNSHTRITLLENFNVQYSNFAKNFNLWHGPFLLFHLLSCVSFILFLIIL